MRRVEMEQNMKNPFCKTSHHKYSDIFQLGFISLATVGSVSLHFI